MGEGQEGMSWVEEGQRKDQLGGGGAGGGSAGWRRGRGRIS